MEVLTQKWKQSGKPWLRAPLASGRQLREFRRANAPTPDAAAYLRASRTRRWVLRGLAAGLVLAVAGLAGEWQAERRGTTVGEQVALAVAWTRAVLHLYPIPDMVPIPRGAFLMGSADPDATPYERPPHQVVIAEPFRMGKYEVTFAEYDVYVFAARMEGKEEHKDIHLPGSQGWGRGCRPVINVSWEDAVAYAKWLSEQTGKRYRLPTEAEWGYAARAGSTTRFWWGDEVQQDGKVWANCLGCGSDWGLRTAPVGSFPANPFGLYDMAGNVDEWVEDVGTIATRGRPTAGLPGLRAAISIAAGVWSGAVPCSAF
jgi:formylglycine-generating enzyme required for sulfatase activity